MKRLPTHRARRRTHGERGHHARAQRQARDEDRHLDADGLGRFPYGDSVRQTVGGAAHFVPDVDWESRILFVSAGSWALTQGTEIIGAAAGRVEALPQRRSAFGRNQLLFAGGGRPCQ